MKKLAVGLMSGTSGDGVSLALCAFNEHGFELLGYRTYRYPDWLYREILEGPDLKTPQISRLHVILGKYFARSISHFLKKLRLPPSKITVIGSHGQTLYHGPKDRPANTMQIGEPSLVAEQTGIPVVADFRARDIAAGGEGAPLIPFFDHYFFGGGKTRALQNIGGIGNVTVVGKSQPTVAFDTGPGNCLIDWAVWQTTRHRLKYDRSGKIARRGKIISSAVEEMIKHPYFKKKPPKSTGRELFNKEFIPRLLLKEKPENLIATLTYFTAYSIGDSYRRFIPHPLSEIIVSGGGAFNQTLMSHLTHLFTPVPVRPISDYGIPVQAKEPMAFAFFALRALEGKINHWPQGTGAKKACVLGKIIPGTWGTFPPEHFRMYRVTESK